MRLNKVYNIITIFVLLLIIVIVLVVTNFKKENYLARGKISYEKHCLNCHGKNGEGLKLLIPPLTDPVWIENDSIVCIIKNGLEGKISVNKKPYNFRMAGNFEIETDEIADLVSYIRHQFISKPKRMSIKEVLELENRCLEL